MGCTLCQGHQHCDTLRNSTFDIWLCLVSGVSVRSTTIDSLFSTRFPFSTCAAYVPHHVSTIFSAVYGPRSLATERIKVRISPAWPHFSIPLECSSTLLPLQLHHTPHGSGVCVIRVIWVHEKPFFTHVTPTRIRTWQGNTWIVSEQAPGSGLQLSMDT